MRRHAPNKRERTILEALAYLEETDPRTDGCASGYGLHMLSQTTNAWILRGDLTRLCTWELAEVVYTRRKTPERPLRPGRLVGAFWVLTWEGVCVAGRGKVEAVGGGRPGEW